MVLYSTVMPFHRKIKATIIFVERLQWLLSQLSRRTRLEESDDHRSGSREYQTLVSSSLMSRDTCNQADKKPAVYLAELKLLSYT
eukprot:m.230474 g.230474  ORF g.230474 m.230474 type:complete len:85 (+) comp17060_c3_seq4:2385-2639(+)